MENNNDYATLKPKIIPRFVIAVFLWMFMQFVAMNFQDCFKRFALNENLQRSKFDIRSQKAPKISSFNLTADSI